MKFVVDHQLPPALARFLERQRHEASHVRELGLAKTADVAIWAYASSNGLIVVSKDEDFFFLATTRYLEAKLLWVRTGNCRTPFLLERFRINLPVMIQAFQDGAIIVELQ